MLPPSAAVFTSRSQINAWCRSCRIPVGVVAVPHLYRPSPLVSGPQDNTEPTDPTLGHPGTNPTVSIRAYANNQAAFANNARIAPEILQPSEDFGDFDPYTDPECALARKLDSEYFEQEMHSDQFEAAEKSLVKAAFGHARKDCPNKPVTLHMLEILGTTRERIREYNAQEQDYLHLVEDSRDNVSTKCGALVKLADFYTGRHRYSAAIEKYDEAIRVISPTDVWAGTIMEGMRTKKMTVERLARNEPPHPPMRLDDPNFHGPYYKFNHWAGWLRTDHDTHMTGYQRQTQMSPLMSQRMSSVISA